MAKRRRKPAPSPAAENVAGARPVGTNPPAASTVTYPPFEPAEAATAVDTEAPYVVLGPAPRTAVVKAAVKYLGLPRNQAEATVAEMDDQMVRDLAAHSLDAAFSNVLRHLFGFDALA